MEKKEKILPISLKKNNNEKVSFSVLLNKDKDTLIFKNKYY